MRYLLLLSLFLFGSCGFSSGDCVKFASDVHRKDGSLYEITAITDNYVFFVNTKYRNESANSRYEYSFGDHYVKVDKYKCKLKEKKKKSVQEKILDEIKSINKKLTED